MGKQKPRSVADEIGQRTPFSSRGQELMVALLRSSDLLRTRLSARVERVDDVTLQQYNVLRILRGAGDEGLPTLQIAERMIERQPGVTRLIDRLLQKGLVERRRSEKDRRIVRCTITPQGLETLARLDRVIEAVAHQLHEALGEDRLAALIGALDIVRSELRDE